MNKNKTFKALAFIVIILLLYISFALSKELSIYKWNPKKMNGTYLNEGGMEEEDKHIVIDDEKVYFYKPFYKVMKYKVERISDNILRIKDLDNLSIVAYNEGEKIYIYLSNEEDRNIYGKINEGSVFINTDFERGDE